MAEQILSDRQQDTILDQIEEKMDVYGNDGKHIGQVEWVYYGSVSEKTTAEATGAATPDDPKMRQRNFIDDIAEVFDTDGLPQELRERLLREGFIRIDADGLFASDRFAMPSQIESVTDDRVTLHATKSELVKE